MSARGKQVERNKGMLDLVGAIASMSAVVKWQPLQFENRPPFNERVLFCNSGFVYIGKLDSIEQRYEAGAEGDVCTVEFHIFDDDDCCVGCPDFWAVLVPAPVS